MTYKIKYYKLALMEDGTNGNINMGYGVAYTDAPIERIPTILNDSLQSEKRIGVVTSLEKVEGKCIG